MSNPTSEVVRQISENIHHNYNRAASGWEYNKNPAYFDAFEKKYDKKTHSFPAEVKPQLTRGYVPPPFNYLGPGNSLNAGVPYNFVDADAEKHDHQYNTAKTSQDVQSSDLEFISHAGDHIVEGISGQGSISDTLGAIAGIVGIGGKHLTEKTIGKTLYPNLGKYGQK